MNPRLSELIRKKYPVEDMAPEEYAARYGHEVRFVEQHYDHGDQLLEDWLSQVLRVLQNPLDYERVRQEYLDEGQKAEVEKGLALVASRLRKTYPVEDMCPEEYVGLYSHTSSQIRFDSHLLHGDSTLQDWFNRVIAFLDDYDEAAKLRRRYLNESELEEVEAQISAARSEFRQRYPIDTMGPEEFVARRSHMNPYVETHGRHFDGEIRDWLNEVERLLRGFSTRELLRQEFLGPDELHAVRHHQARMRKLILELHPIETVTPEEFAARYAHTIYLLGIAQLDHGDQRIADWFDELQLIMANETLLNELRQRLLSPEELKRVEKEILDQNDPYWVP